MKLKTFIYFLVISLLGIFTLSGCYTQLKYSGDSNIGYKYSQSAHFHLLHHSNYQYYQRIYEKYPYYYDTRYYGYELQLLQNNRYILYQDEEKSWNRPRSDKNVVERKRTQYRRNRSQIDRSRVRTRNNVSKNRGNTNKRKRTRKKDNNN